MISDEDVKKLAELARLDVSPATSSSLLHHLNSILEYVRQLSALDTTDVELMSYVHSGTNVFRTDDTSVTYFSEPCLGEKEIPLQGPLTIEEIRANAPDASGRFIKVPLIME